MVVTGLVIGTGSAPVHSLIGLLQNTRDAVDQARALWSGKAIKEVAEALSQAQAGATRQLPPAPLASPMPPTDASAAGAQAAVPAGTVNEIEFRRMAKRLLR
jgi:hypothetical protein